MKLFIPNRLVNKMFKYFRNIPDMENWYSKLYDSKDVSDPFVDVKLGKCRIAKTRVIDNSLNPKWNESFKVEVCHKANSLIFDVRDKDHAYTEVIGIVDVPCHDLINGQVIEGWRPIVKGSKVNICLNVCNTITITVTF